MSSRARKPLSLVLLASLTCLSSHAFAQTATAADRIRAASAHSGLGQETEKPWHLKLDETIFDDQGKNPQTGTIEVWNDGDDRRTIIQFGDSTATRLTVGRQIYRSSTGGPIPSVAEDLLTRIMQPGPSESEISESKPEVRKQSFGKLKLDCIMLAQPIPRLAYAPLGLFPTYCLAPDSDTILVGYDFGSQAFVQRQSGTFLQRRVPINLELQNAKGAVIASAKVASLSTFRATPDLFTPPADVKATTGMARVAGGVIAGAIVTKVPPVYPESAKMNHVTGTVVLRAIIGTDGHIRSLRPVSAPDPDLALAAIYAVRQWTYKPYMLNGEPTSVDTTITVNFSMN
jgi:TonB family protein